MKLTELDTARETIKRLNRRCQQAEAAAAEKVNRSDGSLGRGLANWSAAHQRRRAEAAEAELARITGTTANAAELIVAASIFADICGPEGTANWQEQRIVWLAVSDYRRSIQRALCLKGVSA